MYGIQPSAVSPTSAPSGSTGTSRQPRTSRPSSAAMASTVSRAAARATGSCGRKQMPAAKVLAPSAVGCREFEVDDVAQQLDGQLEQDARSVTAVGFGACRSAVLEVLRAMRPSATIECERRPWMSVTMATPQESASLVGVVQALGFGQCREQHGMDLRSPEISLSGTAPARVGECISAVGGYPPRTVGTSGNPGRLRTTVHATAATMTTTIGRHGHQPACPVAGAPAARPAAAGSPMSRKTLSTNAAARSPCSRS